MARTQRYGHTHPCETEGCTHKVPCDGEMERNDDGWPTVICHAYHLPGGSVARVICEDCEARVCQVCEGTGVVDLPDDEQADCSACQGTGMVPAVGGAEDARSGVAR